MGENKPKKSVKDWTEMMTNEMGDQCGGVVVESQNGFY